MKILLIGNCARSHIIAETLSKSRHKPEIFAFMGAKNPGIAKIAKEYDLGKLNDVPAIISFAKKIRPDFAFISPELPLSVGAADALLAIGVPTVGPIKELADLECSKSFVLELMDEYKISGAPRFRIFKSMAGIDEFLDELGDTGYVLKPDGLTGGKGVMVSGDHVNSKDDALSYCKEIISKHGRIVIEEKLNGEEFSQMCFVDGKTVVEMPPVQDHKRAFEGDKGSNTGGMGSYSYPKILPFIIEKDLTDAHKINVAVNDAMYRKYGKYYNGIMYGGFMATKNGVKLIEYNARLGDPEAMNVLSVLKTDFVDISLAIVRGTLSSLKVEFEPKATVCKYIVPEGYPDKPKSGDVVDVSGVSAGAKIYFSSVNETDGRLVMGSSRAIALVGVADSIDEAEKIAETACMQVKGPVRHRKDIGTRALVQKRIDHMKRIRGK